MSSAWKLFLGVGRDLRFDRDVEGGEQRAQVAVPFASNLSCVRPSRSRSLSAARDR